MLPPDLDSAAASPLPEPAKPRALPPLHPAREVEQADLLRPHAGSPPPWALPRAVRIWRRSDTISARRK